jgi:CTP:molybdopterin cytidylyltransferase MocA
MTTDPAIAAVILAAGFSQRMGSFKPLLPLGPDRTIVRVVNTFQSAGIGDVLIVTGHRSAEVLEAVSGLSVRCITNADFQKGMFTSVLAGVRSLPVDCRAFFVHPVDIPLVKPRTIRQLTATFKESSPLIVYPTFDARRGHPPLIEASLVPRILAGSGEGGLRALLKGHDAHCVELAVEDEGILMDLDTPEDYRQMQSRFLL